MPRKISKALSNAQIQRRRRMKQKYEAAGLDFSQLPVRCIPDDEDLHWEVRWKELGYDKMVEEYEKKEVNAWEDCYRSSSHKLREWLRGEAPTTRYVKQAGNRRGDR